MDRAVYLMTRDNVLEGDTGASGLARGSGRTVQPAAPLRIQVPAHVGANFEGLVVGSTTPRARRRRSPLEAGAHLRRPGHWTEPGVRHLAAERHRRRGYRTDPLHDQWELYDLTADPIEARNRWSDPDCTNCASTCGCNSSRRGPRRCRSATSRGRTPTDSRRPENRTVSFVARWDGSGGARKPLSG